MSICLNMIVKDEASVIKRCLESVKPFIDEWVIVDTGSSDATPLIVAETLKDLPGALYHSPWVNFAHNRNEALQLAFDSTVERDYLFFIDADEELCGHAPAYPLGKEAYDLEVNYGNLTYARVALVQALPGWRWIGPVHEYLELGYEPTRGKIETASIRVHTDGNRSLDPQKYAKDAVLLEEALKADPMNARNWFYLAQSYRDSGDYTKALEAYSARAAIKGWIEEDYIASLWAGRCAQFLGLLDEAIGYYTQAYILRPTRQEALVELACLYHDKAKALQPTQDRLFVEPNILDKLKALRS